MQRRNAALRTTPKGLAFAQHVDGFVTGQGAPSRPEGPKALAGFDPPLDGAVVLFHKVIEVTPDSMLTMFVQSALGFEFYNGGRVSRMPIGVDHPRHGGLAQQRYVKSHRILANCRGVKDFRRFRNSQDGTWFSRSVLGA
jgi:hypothetical protein